MVKKVIKNVEVTTLGDVRNCKYCRKADIEIPGYVAMAKGKYNYVDLKDRKFNQEIKKSAKILNKNPEKIDEIPLIRIKKTVCTENACKTVEKVMVGYSREEIKKEIGLTRKQ